MNSGSIVSLQQGIRALIRATRASYGLKASNIVRQWIIEEARKEQSSRPISRNRDCLNNHKVHQQFSDGESPKKNKHIVEGQPEILSREARLDPDASIPSSLSIGERLMRTAKVVEKSKSRSVHHRQQAGREQQDVALTSSDSNFNKDLSPFLKRADNLLLDSVDNIFEVRRSVLAARRRGLKRREKSTLIKTIVDNVFTRLLV